LEVDAIQTSTKGRLCAVGCSGVYPL